MASRRSVTIGSVVLLTALLAVAQVEFASRLLGPVWRAAVLSWDNPATQVVDELACDTLPHSDPSGEARHAVLTPRTSGRVHARSQVLVPAPALPSRATRSPPSA